MKRKPRHLMGINELIANAGWFDGTDNQWQALSSEERSDRSFAATGCAVAYATWEAPVNCLHTGCQIRRGELPAIAETNSVLRGEMSSGWLRFHKDSKQGRQHLARICRTFRKAARETGIYDPWKLSWSTIVHGGIAQV